MASQIWTVMWHMPSGLTKVVTYMVTGMLIQPTHSCFSGPQGYFSIETMYMALIPYMIQYIYPIPL